jgi:hypothetical protein
MAIAKYHHEEHNKDTPKKKIKVFWREAPKHLLGEFRMFFVALRG